jgi:hypothetical protein
MMEFVTSRVELVTKAEDDKEKAASMTAYTFLKQVYLSP